MTQDPYELVERYFLPERIFISQDGEIVRVRDIVYLTVEGNTPVAVTEDNKKHSLLQKLNVIEKEFLGYFLRVHRSFLVAIDRVKVVYERYPEANESESATSNKGGAADECELALRGTETRIPVTTTYSGDLKKALGVRSLHHLVPEHPDDKKLRNLGIIDFAWRELYALNLEDTKAVEAYVTTWRIVRFGMERTLRYFRKFGENQIDKRRLAKNIIWQVWRWIKKGIRKQFDGNIRSFWYEVKNALGGDDILDAEDVDIFYASLQELIEEHHLFRYKDFGFMDMNKPYHAIGKLRPEIILSRVYHFM